MKIKIRILGSEESEIVALRRFREKKEIAGVRYLWKSEIDDMRLKIFESDTGDVNKIEKDSNISTPDDEILTQFDCQKEQIVELESAGIEYTDENEGEEDPIPYDLDLIRIDPRSYHVNLVHDLIEDGDIDLVSDFQRHSVWKDISQRSRLIESLMLRIPLPDFYMAQDSEGKFQIVDGLQRLTVINQFLKNEFRLKELKYLKDCEGAYFKKEAQKSIDSKYARRITQTRLSFNVIDPQTPFRVKFDIFRRINQGGEPLNAQEIRNRMAYQKARKLLEELSNSGEFKTATDHSVIPARMEDQELALRFIGFYYHRYINNDSLKYSGNMDNFLDDVVDVLNKSEAALYKKFAESFYRAMMNATYLFGTHAFRKCKKEHLDPGAGKQLINKSLFTTWSVILSQYDPDDVKNKVKKKHLSEPLALEIENNARYFDAITIGVNAIKKINTSFEIAEKIVKEHL